MDVLLTKRVKTSGTRQGFYFVRALILSVFILLSFSCASTRRAPYTYVAEEQAVYLPEQFNWKPVYTGVDYFCYENKAFPVRYHCVKIDLHTEGLQIIAFPADESDYKHKNGERTPFFTGKRTGSFARKSGAEIVINTSPFAGKNGKWDTYAHISSTRKIVGIHIVNGVELSPPHASYSALIFKKADDGWKAEIIDSQTSQDVEGADFAFGGFWTTLRDGEKKGKFAPIHDSRTACGITKDGSTLFLLIVEGEFLSMSEGLSYPECTDIFLAMGADDAMQFDGGGSSSLFIGGKNMLSYPSARINAGSIGFSLKSSPNNH